MFNLMQCQAAMLLDNPIAYTTMSSIHNPYGDEKACERIIASLQNERRDVFHV
jgi:UDP-N-acetylglucosamine 2-epimerase